MGGYRPKLEDELVSQIFALRKLGSSHYKISSELGISRVTVGQYLNPDVRNNRRKRARDYRRHNRLSTTVDGKHQVIKVKKRPRPETCELCNELPTKMEWHHWNDNHPEIGMWLCSRCHRFAEGVDRGLSLDLYLELKRKFTDEKLLIPLEVEIAVSPY